MRLRSSTSSCRLTSPSSPSMRVMSLFCRNSVRRLVREASCRELMAEIWLPPSCRTWMTGKSSRAATAAPPLGALPCVLLLVLAVRARYSSGLFSTMRRGLKVHSSPSRLLFSLSTDSWRSRASPDMSTRVLLSRLSSCRHSNSSPRKALPTSRSLRPEMSRSRMRSNMRWPSFSSRKSSVRRPEYLDLAAACSAASIGTPSRTLSLRTL
mmetsp:Transcript_4566/g.9836  ORF Transcript_4566/g.9836 Transcript_4566/m.9836 type:complete len:210 (-) Transcript_4566:104-733(-)